jgi:hypothetical protein
MMGRMKALLLLLLVGCRSPSTGPTDLSPLPTGTVRLTVTATTPIADIDHLAVTVEAGGGKTTIQLFSPATIPPGVTFDLQVVAGYTANVTVEAIGAMGKILGMGGGTTQAATDHSVDLTVTLQPV